METTTSPRIGWLLLLVGTALLAAAATVASFAVMDPLIPCTDEFCFNRLVMLPLSGFGALIIAIWTGWYARRGARGALAALAAGAVGYVVALNIISGGLLIRL